jgi:TonB family protein
MSRLTRFLNLFRREALERDLDQELAFHLDMRIERNREQGLSHDEAVADARRRFGETRRAKEEMRTARLLSLSHAQKAGVLAAIGLIVAIVVGAALDSQRTVYGTAQEGITVPVLVKEVKPQYTAVALKNKIRGAVMLECVVETTGVCGDLRVTKSLDPEGLDLQALRAARAWRFRPGTREGQPVPVAVTVEMQFTLR